jgi:hypothetical protein
MDNSNKMMRSLLQFSSHTHKIMEQQQTLQFSFYVITLFYINNNNNIGWCIYIYILFWSHFILYIERREIKEKTEILSRNTYICLLICLFMT